MAKRWIMIAVFLLAAVMRMYALSHVPPAASLDEATIGWNAYSIAHTGRDEYRQFFPLLLRAYDDWRPALYVYLVVPLVALLGPMVTAVRLPSVILSLIVVYLSYRIGERIGKKYFHSEWLGVWVSLLVAISPWHIYISRLGHEANLGLALFTAGIYFFLEAVVGNISWWVVVSAVCFALSLHGYQSEKLTTPIMLLAGTMVYRRWLMAHKRETVIAIMSFLVIALPAVFVTFSREGLSRFSGTSAFAVNTPRAQEALATYTAARARGDVWGRVVNSKAVVGSRLVVENYLSHFSPKWLWTGGEREAHKVPGLGLMYVWEAPLLFAGVWAIKKRKLPVGLVLFGAAWFFGAPMPASITTDAPHAMRSYTFVPVMQLVEAMGLIMILGLFSGKARRAGIAGMMLLVAGSLCVFWNGYFLRFPAEQSDSFSYALHDALRYASSHDSGYADVVVSNEGNLYQSYMFYLFDTSYDPVKYQMGGGTYSGGYAEPHSIGKYQFRAILPGEHFKSGTLLLVDAGRSFEGRAVATFANLDGKPAIIAYEL